MSASPTARPTPPDAADRLLGALLALPAAVLVLPAPLGPLAGVFGEVEAAGAGALVLACLPAALALALRARRGGTPLARLALAPLFAFGVAAALVPASDTFARDARLAQLAAGTTLLVAAAGLGPAGRRTLERGLVFATLLALAPAALATGAEGLAGVLGNAGETSAAALPGALVGLALALVSSHRLRRALGALAWLAALVHAWRAPVLASLLVLAAAPALAALVAPRRRRAAPLVASACAAALFALALTAHRPGERLLEDPRLSAEAPPVALAAGDLGGVPVRLSIWRRTLALAAAHPLLGVGPGQFAAAFPPYRDPAEIERSSLGRRLSAETEVEHPHQDALLAASEAGLVGALAWLALMLAGLVGALRAVRRDGPGGAPLALGALAALLASLANAPLLANPAAAAAGFTALGACLSGGRAAAEARGPGRFVPAALALLLVLSVPQALALLRHGRALSGPEPAAGAIERALAARPDSPLALGLRARALEASGAPPERCAAAWQAVLDRRPHRVEAHIQRAVRLAEAGRAAEAREELEAARDLDPKSPTVLSNLAWLELSHGRLAAGEAALEALVATGHADPVRLLRMGAELLLRGLAAEGQAVLARADPRLADLSGERAYALAREYRRKGERRIAEALESHAHRLWAWEHAARGDFASARRVMRQNLRITRDAVPGGPTRVRLELAALELETGRADEAREHLRGLSPSAQDWAALPAWAGRALAAAGYGPGRALPH